MTAPVETPQEQDQDHLRRRHKRCVTQRLAAYYGQARVTLCGKVMTGPVGSSGEPLTPCPICFELYADHVATCPACKEVKGT